ncbi:MAG: rhodanese-like domain-containing protein [Thermosynechococcaceae cyanobacterium MS004]|nr:rhodanese-like domain-containing protein [Thermosynechococcaceae cyanobacterium MS004]
MTSKSTAKPVTNPILLTPTQFKARQKEFLVIDVRGWLEYWMAHIPGAKRLSRDLILKTVSKDQAIALTCLSGHRSAMAAQWLVGQGYGKVHNLKGGLLSWQNAGYAVQRGNRP